MRRFIVRMISFILVVSFLFMTPHLPLNAEQMPETAIIRISSSENPDPMPYTVIIIQNELYMKSQDLAAVTRYRFGKTQDKRLMFMLGQKQVFVDPAKSTLTFRGHTTTIRKPVLHENDIWLPMSQMLPWLNTNCDVQQDGSLNISSDPVSIWEVKSVLDQNLTKYLFNVEEEYNGTQGAATILFSMFLMDTILKARLFRAVPYKDGSWRDYEIYMDAFREFAVDDFLLFETVEDTVKMLDGFAKINSIAQYASANLPSASNTAIQAFGDVLGDVSSALETANEISDLIKLKELSSSLAYIEASYLTSDEYYLTFKYVYGADKPGRTRTVAEEAARQSYEIYRSTSDANEFAKRDYLTNSILSIFESNVTKKLLSTKAVYLKAIDTVLGLTWPVNKAAENTVSLPVYVNMQHDAIDSYHRYEEKINPTVDDITAMRLSAMLFLKSGKRAVQAKETLLDRFDGKGLVEWRLQEYNVLLSSFALSAAAMENDSASDKSAVSQRLIAMFAELEKGQSSVADNSVRGNTNGNIVNGGLAVADGDSVIHLGLLGYFASDYPYSFAFYRTRTDGSQMTHVGSSSGSLVTGYMDNLNSYDGKLYYTSYDKLQVANMDGSDPVVLAENVFGNIHVVDDMIYYTQWERVYYDGGEESYSGNIHKISLESGIAEAINTSPSDSVNIVNDRIYYIDRSNNNKLTIMDLNGGNKTVMQDIEAGVVIVDNGWLYYTNRSDDNKLYRANTTGSNPERISDDSVKAFNIYNNQLYYCGGGSGQTSAIYRMNQDGTGRELIHEDTVYQISIAGNRIFALTMSGIISIDIDSDTYLGLVTGDPYLLYPQLGLENGAVIVNYDFVNNPLGMAHSRNIDMRDFIYMVFDSWGHQISLIQNQNPESSFLAIAGDVYNVSIGVTLLYTEYEYFQYFTFDKISDTVLVIDHFTDSSSYVIRIAYEDQFGTGNEIVFSDANMDSSLFGTIYHTEVQLPLK